MNMRISALVMVIFLVAPGDCFIASPRRTGCSAPQPNVVVQTPVPAQLTFDRVRLFGTSIVHPQLEDDEVNRLLEMATKVRQEATSMETQQKAAMTRATQSIFRKFDTDNNGSISVQELQRGLKQIFKLNLPEERTRQLVKEFDANGDGELQLDEFVGAEKFRNKLDAIVHEERDLVCKTQEAEAQVQADKISLVQMELVNNRAPSDTDKIVSVLPYLFPLLDGLWFARFFIEGNPDNHVAIAATVAYALYRSIPFGGLLSFFGLRFLSENPKINRLVRFNLQQAALLDIVLFAPALIAGVGAALLSQAGIAIPPSVVELSSDATFLALLGAIAYASTSSLLGEAPNKIPFVSERTEKRMMAPDMFEANRRFSPYDGKDSRKKPRNVDEGTNEYSSRGNLNRLQEQEP